jgi:hypothetical protein
MIDDEPGRCPRSGLTDYRLPGDAMGHRALVAYERPDGRYDVHYSHWGGENLSLGARISRETPLAVGAVEASPLAGPMPFERLLECVVDPCIYEALYVVDLAFETVTTHVCWLGWNEEPDERRGALVVSDSTVDDREFSTWLRATKTVLADLVDVGG